MATTSAELLLDGFERVRDVVHQAVDGLSADELAYRVDPEANSIGWLVWHLTRVQDDHVADAAGIEQVWTTKGWADRFGLPFKPTEIGYGQSSDEVGAAQVASHELLTGYYDAVHQQTVDFVGEAHRRRARTGRRRAVGSTGDVGRPVGQCDQRRSATCWSGGLRPRRPVPPLRPR